MQVVKHHGHYKSNPKMSQFFKMGDCKANKSMNKTYFDSLDNSFSITHGRWRFKCWFFFFVEVIKVKVYHRTVMSQVMIMVLHEGKVILVNSRICHTDLVFKIIQPIASRLQPFVVPAVVLQLGLWYERYIELTLATFGRTVLLNGFVRVSPCGVM